MDLRERTGSPVRHPWEIVRAERFVALVADDARGRRVLDVGAGDGYLATRLWESARPAALVAFDPHYDDADLARSEGAHGPTFVRVVPQAAFDVVLALDVVEHVDDDEAFVRDLAARLVPGGLLVVSVPSIPSLFGPHDLALGHRRRYAPSAIQAVVRSAGLRVERHGGLFPGLALARRASLVLGRRRPSAGLAWDAPGWLTSLVVGSLRADAEIGVRAPVLPSLSTWLTARKP